jgi:hypothetical protein
MLQIRRTKGREAVDADGRSFALVGETWNVRLTTPWIGFGYSYLRPVAVQGTSACVTIRDHLMVARIAAFVLLAAGTLISWRGK